MTGNASPAYSGLGALSENEVAATGETLIALLVPVTDPAVAVRVVVPALSRARHQSATPGVGLEELKENLLGDTSCPSLLVSVAVP